MQRPLLRKKLKTNCLVSISYTLDYLDNNYIIFDTLQDIVRVLGSENCL